ncbi:MAG TPA: ABC transporter ATP-binding protein [Rhodocyclaceae bacterium]|nr:ABC transporter ATP-binding protein [Rhodocyclaceae bacterium]
MSALLEVDNLETFYGASQALFGVGLRIEPGEMVTLLGRNGMGKTTTVHSIVGLVRPRGGMVRFRGEAIQGLDADRLGRAGIGLVPEGRQIFPNLTVRENLVAWASNRSGAATPWTLDKVFAFFPRLAERQKNMGNQLSGGEQQMLAIGRVLMTNPHLVILDEATEGLAPLIREEIWRCLSKLKADGLAVLVIDKYVRNLVAIADRHYILERGHIRWEGDSAALSMQPELWHRYLGV